MMVLFVSYWVALARGPWGLHQACPLGITACCYAHL
jgi:hypothetical protein